MRTTLDLDEDVLRAAKEIAATRGTTVGKVLSALARRGLAAPTRRAPVRNVRNGVPVLPRRAATAPRPTLRLVKELRDDG